MITHTGAAHDTGCGCSECASARRNNYFKGKSMRAEAFQIEQRYGIDRRRLLNRSIAGWGVVAGLPVVEGDPPKPTVVGPGLALDRHGRELALNAAATIGLDNTFVFDHAKNCRLTPLDRAEDGGRYLLKIHYAERPYGDAPSPDDCGCDEHEKNFVCETVAFSLTLLRHGKCPCEGCRCRRGCDCPPDGYLPYLDHDGNYHEADEDDDDDHYHQAQPLATQSSEQRAEEPADDDDEAPVDRHDHRRCGSCGRGPHACLCRWITGSKPPEDDGSLCDWKGLRIDPRDGVPLACVKVGKTDDKCHPIAIQVLDDCSPRRLVKNNDLLYDLIRGCDTTKISDISWREWYRLDKYENRIEWEHFANMFPSSLPKPERGQEGPPVRSEFVIMFSDPVIRNTLLPHTVTMTAFIIEQNSNWLLPKRVPIIKLDTTPSRPLPDGLTDQARLYMDYAWYADEIGQSMPSWLRGCDEFGLEIEIRGDLILDCHRQAVDANAHGRSPAPTGNGTPGGTFISSFLVNSKSGGSH